MNKAFWKNKKVLVTGHTGFKGSWLVMMLKEAGAIVGGFSREIPTTPSVFESCRLEKLLAVDGRGDISNSETFTSCLNSFSPHIVFHLAAQPLVRASYKDPFETYRTNVMGTLNVLMAASQCSSVTTIVNITTDKCYENKEWHWGYREIDPLGGHDPYSSSKACAEILSASIKKSFLEKQNKGMATARAGNVIGGGDWAEDRIVPDFMRAFKNNVALEIRNPHAIRPWQHVIEPLSGYMLLAEKLFKDKKYASSWNFGPEDVDCKNVEYITSKLHEYIPHHKGIKNVGSLNDLHEATFLKLDCSKAKSQLGWAPKLQVQEALKLTADWYMESFKTSDMYAFSVQQILFYNDKK